MGNSTGKLTELLRPAQYKEDSKLEYNIQDQFETLNCLPLDFVKAITSNFSEEHELGRDRFGVVYKVCLDMYMSIFFLHFLCLNALY